MEPLLPAPHSRIYPKLGISESASPTPGRRAAAARVQRWPGGGGGGSRASPQRALPGRGHLGQRPLCLPSQQPAAPARTHGRGRVRPVSHPGQTRRLSELLPPAPCPGAPRGSPWEKVGTERGESQAFPKRFPKGKIKVPVRSNTPGPGPER